MIDIHSHILFGVDDGPRDLEGSLVMLRDAEKMGYSDIVCTSHFYPEVYENKDYDRNFKILSEKIKEEKIDVRIYKGNETVANSRILNHLKEINTINGTSYLLIELDPGTEYDECRKFMKKLMKLGYRPILAHIERYVNFTLEQLKNLHNMGIIFQINIREIAEMSCDIRFIFENRYLEIVATDCHRIDKRNYHISEYIERLKKEAGEEYFNILTCANPDKILRGEEIELKEWKDEKDRGVVSKLLNKIKDYL